WPLTLEDLARKGLPCSGSLGPVCHEFAKWLYWVELYFRSEEERKARILQLLGEFVAAKHNGTSTRMASLQGRAEIKAQIARAVKLAVKLDPSCRSASLELFA